MPRRPSPAERGHGRRPHVHHHVFRAVPRPLARPGPRIPHATRPREPHADYGLPPQLQRGRHRVSQLRAPPPRHAPSRPRLLSQPGGPGQAPAQVRAHAEPRSGPGASQQACCVTKPRPASLYSQELPPGPVQHPGRRSGCRRRFLTRHTARTCTCTCTRAPPTPAVRAPPARCRSASPPRRLQLPGSAVAPTCRRLTRPPPPHHAPPGSALHGAVPELAIGPPRPRGAQTGAGEAVERLWVARARGKGAWGVWGASGWC